MENGKNDFHSRTTGLMVDIHGNSPSVIHNGNAVILVDIDFYGLTETGQRFIHSVIHNLIHQMMQTAK